MTQEAVIDARGLGELIRRRRRELDLRQPDLAMMANVGTRFIVDLENGKESCQIGLTLRLLTALGIRLTAESEPAPNYDADGGQDLGMDDGSFKP